MIDKGTLYYLTAWGAYLLAVTGLYALLWPLFRRIRRKGLQRFLRALYVWLFYTPAFAAAKGFQLAPAFMVVVYSAVEGETGMLVQGGLFYLGSLALFVSLYILDRALHAVLHPHGHKTTKAHAVRSGN
ncbi:hypothetical protein AAIA72_03840 [Hahella sp. SMD15-11]|uniref:MFS transporter n=1 Tax=Thermohahella caldifontis TaxID=3142973 RepID=A0AB39UY15_9GAMM